MAAPKGHPRYGGRAKGTTNKNTTELKDAIMAAFRGAGGTGYLIQVAQENPAVFCQLLGKVLPSEVKAEIGMDVLNVVKRIDLTGKATGKEITPPIKDVN